MNQRREGVQQQGEGREGFQQLGEGRRYEATERMIRRRMEKVWENKEKGEDVKKNREKGRIKSKVWGKKRDRKIFMLYNTNTYIVYLF